MASDTYGSRVQLYCFGGRPDNACAALNFEVYAVYVERYEWLIKQPSARSFRYDRFSARSSSTANAMKQQDGRVKETRYWSFLGNRQRIHGEG